MLSSSILSHKSCLGLVLAGALTMGMAGENGPKINPHPGPFAEDHVIVKFRPEAGKHVHGKNIELGLRGLAAQLDLPRGASLRESAYTRWHRQHGPPKNPNPSPQVNVSRWMYLDLPAGWTVEQCLAFLAQHPLVEYAEADGLGEGGILIPDDPSFPRQWHHQNTRYPGADIKTPLAWDLTTGSSNVIVAILDTGLNLGLEEFAGRLVPGYDFVNDDSDPTDDHGHGSAVASVLAATGQNGLLTAGVDWRCGIMPIKVLNQTNFGTYSFWSQGIDFAVANGAKVINLSAGGMSDGMILEESIDAAIQAGVIFVTITHNDGSSSIRFPGRLPQCITVGATDNQDRWGTFSNFGPQIDLVAPGQSIVTGNRFGSVSTVLGTSFASPLVAGVCALMAGINPALQQSDMSDLLTFYAEDQLGDPKDVAGFDPYFGWGRMNAFDSVLAANGGATDLILSQTESFEPASVGCDVVYALTLTNRSGLVATNVIVTNWLPVNVSLSSASTSVGTVFSTSTEVVFELGNLAGLTSVELEVVLRPTQAGVLTNWAEVTFQGRDPFPDDNQSIELTVALIDEEPPRVASAWTREDGQAIELVYSEPIQFSIATNRFNYLLLDGSTNDVPILDVVAGDGPDRVVLMVDWFGYPPPFCLAVLEQEDCLGNRASDPQILTIHAQDVVLVGAQSSWRYLDDGSNQETGWREPEFPDDDWKSGLAPLGYGNGDEATEVEFGPDSESKYITTYFRREFAVPNASLLTNVMLRLQRDDGAVVYLNGDEIVRDNMPAGVIGHTTRASSAVANDDETEFFLHPVAESWLRDGINVLAVEIHQILPDSSDIRFDLELVAQSISLALPPWFETQPQSRTVLEGDDVEFRVEISGTPPFGYEWRKFPNIIVPFGTGGPSLVLTNVEPSHSGSYLVFVTNAVTSPTGVASSIARLTVLADSDMDRMPDEWELLHDLNPNSPADAALDLDGDGTTNLEEYQAGTDPRVSDIFVRIETIASSTEGIVITFMASSNRSYSVMYRDTLFQGPNQKLMDIPAHPSDQLQEVLDPNPVSGQRFYWLVTPQQP